MAISIILGISRSGGISQTGGISPVAGISDISGTTPPAPYPLSFSALGISGTAGYVYDGLVSKFYTDSAMTTLCANSGSDPVGAVEDLSGNGNHAIQATSANKPVYYSDGTIKSLIAGLVSGVTRTMSTMDTVTDITEMTVYIVLKNGTRVGSESSWPLLFLNSGSTNYAGIRGPSDSPNGYDTVTPAGFGSSYEVAGPTSGGAAGVLRMAKLDNTAQKLFLAGKNSVSFSGMSVPPVNNTSASGSMDTPATLFGRDVAGAKGVSQIAFMFCAFTYLIGTDAQTTIETYITDNLAAWAGN